MGLNDCFKEHEMKTWSLFFLITVAIGEKRKVPVKLDCFHAIQRYTSTLPRKNVTTQLKILRNQMIRFLSQLFVTVQIQGISDRKQHLIHRSARRILMNIDNFLRQCGNIQTNGTQVFPELSRNALEKLLVHVRLRCLLFIPVSGGTSRNECLHKVLNKTLRNRKIGRNVGKVFL